MEVRTVRGMHDLYGEEIDRWVFVEEKVKKILSDFGYGEIRTPVLEHKEVFSQTIGEQTDIVEKQMYMVEGDAADPTKDRLVMRPEGTSAFIRSVLEHQLHQTGKAGRYFYYAPMFRHERPQKGRLRQFHQFGAEIINDATPESDVEIIALLHHLYGAFGVTEYVVRVNSVGCGDCRPLYREVLKDYFRPHLAELCPQCQARFERAPMRILDCKNEACSKVAASAPKILDHLCAVCKTHQAQVVKRLKQLQVPFVEDPSIVRGLDYYIRTAFEFTSDLLGAQSALVGGGRYDGLATRFGAKPLPAVGFGLGMERLMMVLEQKNAFGKVGRKADFYLAPIDAEAFDLLYGLAHSLRRRGYVAEMLHETRSLKAQLKQADKSGARFALLLGEDERKAGQAILKEMATGVQEKMSLDRLEEDLVKRLSK